jgi:site-specific recombinase
MLNHCQMPLKDWLRLESCHLFEDIVVVPTYVGTFFPNLVRQALNTTREIRRRNSQVGTSQVEVIHLYEEVSSYLDAVKLLF